MALEGGIAGLSKINKRRFSVYYRVGEQEPLSTTWQFWAHMTSFYLTNNALGGLKISLHGWDPRFPGGGHFRVEWDPRSGKGMSNSKTVALAEPRDGWPVRFDGAQRPKGVLAIRIRVARSACILDPAPPSSDRPGTVLASLPWPGSIAGREELYGTDLDLYFSQVPAGFDVVNEFPNFVEVGRANSKLFIAVPSRDPRAKPGFMIRNDRGVILRGSTTHHLLEDHPTPPRIQESAAPLSDAAVRGIHIDVDDEGVLWIVEHAVETNDVSLVGR